MSESDYTITTEPDLRTSLSINFYCEQIRTQDLINLGSIDLRLLAEKAVLAADALVEALNKDSK